MLTLNPERHRLAVKDGCSVYVWCLDQKIDRSLSGAILVSSIVEEHCGLVKGGLERREFV